MVKKLILFLVFLFYFPTNASAHLAGQPPFFKINNIYADLYPVPLTSLENFNLPQDLAPDNYLINQQLNLELDENLLPAPPEIVEKTKYDWDYGDNTPNGVGLKNSHTYSEAGSYILRIKANDGTTPTSQLLESVLINVLPNKSYQLPKAIISVNNKQSKDPLTDILQFSFANDLRFDASKSISSSGIREYFWDFGDQKSASGQQQTHLYPKNLSQVFVLLRIKSRDGFIADNFVEVQNTLTANLPNQPISTVAPVSPQTSPIHSQNSNKLPFILGGLIALVITFIFGKRLVNKR